MVRCLACTQLSKGQNLPGDEPLPWLWLIIRTLQILRSLWLLLVASCRPESCPPGFGRRRNLGFGRGAELSLPSGRRATWRFSIKNFAQLRFQGPNFFPDREGAFELFNG